MRQPIIFPSFFFARMNSVGHKLFDISLGIGIHKRQGESLALEIEERKKYFVEALLIGHPIHFTVEDYHSK